MSYAQVENTWIKAGGNPQAAAMAAAIADASSGFDPNSNFTNPDGTKSVGLWLIPASGMPPGSTDPIANARAAVQLSKNGTDWTQWCVAWSDNNCGQENGTYLGEGANALMSLAQRLTPASYNVIGAVPTGSGTSASSATSGTPITSTGSSKLHSMLVVGVVIALVIVVFFMRKKGSGNGDDAEESQGRSQTSWSPSEEQAIRDSTRQGGKSDQQLSAETGRSIRAIRVRRNQMK